MNERQTSMSAVQWLVRFEFGSSWISYVITGGFMLVMGALIANIVTVGALGPEARTHQADSFLSDFVMLLLTTVLATTYTSWGSVSEWRNSAERRLAMMRTLPIPVATLIRSRAVILLLSLVVNVPAFFGPMYLLGDIQLSLGAYLAFVALWVGYALIWSGLTMYLDVVRGSSYFFRMSFILAVILIGLVVLVSAFLGVQIVYTLGRLSSDHGLLAGSIALILGAAAFVMAGRLAIRDLPAREIPV